MPTHRVATRLDLPRILEIYNSTIPGRMATADLEPVSVESRVPWFEEHTPDQRPLWVAAESANVIAWLSFSSFYGRPAYSGTAELSIYVDETRRGEGLGAYLLEAALAHASRIGVTTLFGFIFAHNAPSLALFEGHGFARWAHLPRVAVLDGVERDLVIVGRRVEPAVPRSA
ncbi:MAG: N-acetyltransferase family protein [Dehalococcoidia bacterium]|nr:N-acetyltransferase family protein [Dehalococcoidia bacterium]